MQSRFYKTPLSKYRLDGKTLTPPLLQLPGGTEHIYFQRDLLPEFLWLESLTNYYGENQAHLLLGSFATTFDNYYNLTNSRFFDGTISGFSLIEGKQRLNFIEDNSLLINEVILKPFGDIIALYPNIPMNWLIPNDNKILKEDKEEAINLVRESITRLLPGKDDYAGNIRAMPFNQILRHGRLSITSNNKELITSIEEYPNGDRKRLQSFVRSTFNILTQEHITNSSWPRYFWNQNFKLAPKCNDKP